MLCSVDTSFEENDNIPVINKLIMNALLIKHDKINVY